MIDRIPAERAPGSRGSYGQGDFAPSAQRDRLRKDQYFAAGGDGQSGYGGDFGQLEPSQRHEKQVSEDDIRKAGTAAKSNR